MTELRIRKRLMKLYLKKRKVGRTVYRKIRYGTRNVQRQITMSEEDEVQKHENS